MKDFLKADKPEEGEITLAFVEGGDVPYVALSESMPFLSEALAGNGFEGIEYEVERSVFNGEKLFALKYQSELTDEISEAQPVEMSSKFVSFNFNELCLLLDNFYGLKSEHGISDFREFIFSNDNLMTNLVETDSGRFDAALKDTCTGAQTFMSCTSDTNLNNLYGEAEDTLVQKDVSVY